MNMQQDGAEFGRLPQAVHDAVGLLPLPVLGWIAARAVAAVLRDRPQMFARLGAHAAKRFVFAPVDLPVVFVARPDAAAIDVCDARAAPPADVTVAGPFFVLLALLEGRLDGDAMFFARDIAVTGDMEALLAMRNAIDAAAIDLPRDLAALAGPLGWPVRAVLERVRDAVLPQAQGARWN